MKLRFFRTRILKELFEAVPSNLEHYRDGDFSFLIQDSSLYFESDIEFDSVDIETLNQRDREHNEISDSKLIFERLNITPYFARDTRLWAYLTHTLLLNYTRSRWPIPDSDDDACKHIRTHFFGEGTRGIERDNAASRLWWIAYICSRVQGLTLDEALPAFLHRSDVRANMIERPTTSQCTPVFSAVLEELRLSLKQDGTLFERKRFREVMKRLNLYGGTTLLDTLTEDDARKTLVEIISEVS